MFDIKNGDSKSCAGAKKEVCLHVSFLEAYGRFRKDMVSTILQRPEEWENVYRESRPIPPLSGHDRPTFVPWNLDLHARFTEMPSRSQSARIFSGRWYIKAKVKGIGKLIWCAHS